jgi:hypothetical protein
MTKPCVSVECLIELNAVLRPELIKWLVINGDIYNLKQSALGLTAAELNELSGLNIYYHKKNRQRKSPILDNTCYVSIVDQQFVL